MCLGHTSYSQDKVKVCIDHGAVGVYVCGDPTDFGLKMFIINQH